MRWLLDTHIYLWYLADAPRLTPRARTLIVEAEDVFISAASIWEATIKAGLGRLEVDADELSASIRASGFRELPISAQHAAAVTRLPNHHRDPFDRLLVSQAMHEPMHLLTTDPLLQQYSELVEII